MYKYLIAIVFISLFSGCSYFTFNATLCKQIASEPNVVLTDECRNYIEEEAQKAFDNTKETEQSEVDKVEFNK